MKDIEIKKLSPENTEEFVQLIRVFEEVFEMENLLIPNLNI